jgi:sec-independent protein translocase protein TatC
VKQLAGQGDVRVDVITEDVFIRMDDLNFVFMLVLPFGVLFNLPLVLIVLAKLDFITSAMLAKKRKYIILLAFIAAAVITPTTDILSQCLLALSMIALLEISRLIIRYGLHR